MAEDKTQAVAEAMQSKKNANPKSSQVDSTRGISMIGQMIGLLLLGWLFSTSSVYAIIFFVLAMIPSILALLIDRGAGRFASKTIVACNLIGVMPFLFELFQVYDRDALSRQFIADYTTWFMVYGFAGIGMILIWMFPQVSMLIYTLRTEIKVMHLQDEQNLLLKEWGEGIKEGLENATLPNAFNDNTSDEQDSA